MQRVDIIKNIKIGLQTNITVNDKDILLYKLSQNNFALRVCVFTSFILKQQQH